MDTFQVIIVLMTIKSNSGLIPLGNFYKDPTSTNTLSSGFNGCNNLHNGQLPKNIVNLRGNPSIIYQTYRVSNCGYSQ